MEITHQHGARILSFDGGDVDKSLSTLIILKSLMGRVRDLEGLESRPSPWEHFDMICGCGVGGLFAVMLGKLHMTIDDAIIWHSRLSQAKYGYDKFLTDMIKHYHVDLNAPFCDGDNAGCKTFVLVNDTWTGDLVRLRSYSLPLHSSTTPTSTSNLTTWEVAMAATTLPPREHATKFQYIDVLSVGILNPSVEALREASLVWFQEHISCLVSLGNNDYSGLDKAAEELAEISMNFNLNYYRFLVDEMSEMPSRENVFDATGMYIDEVLESLILPCSRLLLRGIEETQARPTLPRQSVSAPYENTIRGRSRLYGEDSAHSSLDQSEYFQIRHGEVERSSSVPPASPGPSGIESRRAMVYNQSYLPKESRPVEEWANKATHSVAQNLKRSLFHHVQQAQFLATSTNDTRDESEKWLNKIIGSDVNKQLVQRLQASKRKPPQKPITPIKVAILDTGYDPGAIFFEDPQRLNRIKGYIDCAEELSDPRDEDGHGSHVVSLVMKVAPAADIFVARIARNKGGLEKASSNIAQAIKWATQEPIGADIISMSFGFPEEVPDKNELVVTSAILEALKNRKKRLILFAAAANEGGNSKELFPANFPLVISIRGTNHEGQFLSFNPPPDPDGPAVLGTLGQNVPGSGLGKDEGDVYHSGCSVATPIAAGIAAMMLGYANLCYEEGVFESSTVRKLWTKEGMFSMLKAMSTPMLNKQFYLSLSNFGAKSSEDRHAMMISAGSQAGVPYVSLEQDKKY